MVYFYTVIKLAYKKTYFYAAFSIVMWSTLATLSKFLLNKIDSFVCLSYSALFAAAALFAVNLISGNLKNLKKYGFKDYLKIIATSLPGTFFYYVFLYGGTERLLASQAFIINYLWPAMSVIFAAIILKEKITVSSVIALCLSFMGVIIVAGSEFATLNIKGIVGAALCVLAAVSYGLFTALTKKTNYDKNLSMMLSFILCSGLCFVISIMRDSSLKIDAPSLLGLSFNGIFILGLATVTWATALQRGNTAKISNLAYLTPFISLVWTSMFLKEKIGVLSVLGLIIIVIGILIQLKNKKAVKNG